MRIRETESARARRAIAAFDSNYQSKGAHLQEALLTPPQRGEALERRAAELARKVEGLGPRARERAVKRFFAACEREGYTSEDARAAMRAAYGYRKARRSEEMDVPDYHQDRAPGPKPREGEEDEEDEGPRLRDDDDEDDEDDSDEEDDE